jgi:hypothetical protein
MYLGHSFKSLTTFVDYYQAFVFHLPLFICVWLIHSDKSSASISAGSRRDAIWRSPLIIWIYSGKLVFQGYRTF